MKTYSFKFNIKANSSEEAQTKLKALAKLAGSIQTPLLSALAQNGPALLNGPDGVMIRTYLGIG